MQQAPGIDANQEVQPEQNESQTSLVGDDEDGAEETGNSGASDLSPAMKKDRDNYKRKIQTLEKKLRDEDFQNSRIIQNRKGEFIEYGNIIQILHDQSQCYIQATKSCADEDNSCNKIELGEFGAKTGLFKVLGGFKYKQEGDRIHYNDQIVLQSFKQPNNYLHVTEKLLKIEGLDGPIPENLKEGVKRITPKKIDRREPPNHYVPQCEVNLSGSRTKFQIQIYRYHDEDPHNEFIMCGQLVRLLHSERGGFLHSDDKDFTNDGQAEVYLWNFKGKPTDIEANSSSSLFEIELATPLIENNDDNQWANLAKKVNHTLEIKRQDPEQRFGKVMRYSSQGGITQKGEKDEEIHYRLRHLNTGRLVIDQEIKYNGITMRTLGLCPHVVLKNLPSYSERIIDQIGEEMQNIDKTDQYEVLKPDDNDRNYDYRYIDQKSRFRIISTSPSLDDRIKQHSCVQIQHVQSEMFLSYETKSSFAINKKSTTKTGGEDNRSTSDLNISRGLGEKLYCEVDDDDIQSGTRDAIELKPSRSNEDAFFIMPENVKLIQNILFIQTAIDLLKKYLPTICSRNLEISKEKSTKIFELLDRIDSFLQGDTLTQPHQIINQNLSGGFSKEENDMMQKRNENMVIRQKLMRELYLVESLVHIIYLPFSCGDFQLEAVTKLDPIVKVCQKAYNLIKLIGYGYYQNELYVSQWINLYFNHAMSTNATNNIGAEDTIISLVDNNKKLLEMQITPAIIEKIVNLCKLQNRDKQLIQLLKAICSCHGQQIVNNQNDIVQILLEDDHSRSYLMMPVRMKNDGSTDVLMDTNHKGVGSWTSLNNYRKFKKKTFGYFKALIDLSAELCLGRNGKALANLQDMYNFDTVKIIVKDRKLPYEVRSLFMRILLNMHMDREPLVPIQIPSLTGVWNDLPAFIKEQYEGGRENLKYDIKQAKISVPGSLSALKKFVENYLYETQGIQNIFEVGKNMMTIQILTVVQFMLQHGFYQNLKELKEIAIPMINLLNGSNDIYINSAAEDTSNYSEEYASSKRYFNSGNGDNVVQSKRIICENLIIISQLEIDGKVQIFLSKFKCDLDMLILQKQMQHAVKAKEDKEKLLALDNQPKKGCFSRFQKIQFNIGKIIQKPKEKMTFKQLQSDNISFLNEIALSYNFESQSQDAYICVLFDLLLYKYPVLSKGVFELLVRLFTRKRTILENLMKMQMLENPRSIRVLSQINKYHLELKKYITDADTWLNKQNEPSQKIKLRVTQIFFFFSKICCEKPSYKEMEEEEEEENEKSQINSNRKSEFDELDLGALVGCDGEAHLDQKPDKGKISQKDFVLFHQKEYQYTNKENQRLLGNYGIENIAMFFIKFRVDRNAINDPSYQHLIHQCYNFLVNYVRDNLQNQIAVHDHIEIFLRDIDKNPLICLLIYQMFKDNKKFLTLNVSKILRYIILSAEEASLASSKKALYLKLLEVFCKHEDKLVRPNQQEIVINFTRDISKNNLIYLFSTEGQPHLVRLIHDCIPRKMLEGGKKAAVKFKSMIDSSRAAPEECVNLSIEVFNVIMCLKLMSLCCEGKSDLAEMKCQNEIMNLSTSLLLYQKSGKFWPFKVAIIKYVTHLYLDSGDNSLFDHNKNPNNVSLLREVVQNVSQDLHFIQEQFHNTEEDCKIMMPDNVLSSFSKESKIFALDAACHFFLSVIKNKKIDLGVDIYPTYHAITIKIAKLYYDTKSEVLKGNAMDVLSFINNSEKYSHLLENVQHPANQNIYISSNKGNKKFNLNGETGNKSSYISTKLIQLGFNEDMIEQKEREFESLVLWVINIDLRINNIMSHQARVSGEDFKVESFQNVSYNPIVSSFMSLLDSKCLTKDLHITGLTLLRKIIEVENKELTSPSADWEGDDWSEYEQIITSKQNSLVGIGCIEFLCKHIQEIDDEEILEQTFLVCITLLLGGNIESQEQFYKYFQYQDQTNIILVKLKQLLMEQFNLTKKQIGEKNAKLAMVYKLNQRKKNKKNYDQKMQEVQQPNEVKKFNPLNLTFKKAPEEGKDSDRHQEKFIKIEDKAEQLSDEEDENLLTFDDEEDMENGLDEMFMLNQMKTQSIKRCMRLLRFLQLLTEGHHQNLQNFLREQTLPNGVINQRSFDFVSYVAQMLAMYEKQFINCYSCAFGMQLIETLIEVVQGPCKLNQKRLVEAKTIDCCRDLIQQGQQSMYELEIKGFTSEEKLEYHDELKQNAIKLLLSIIEGPVDTEIYRQIADSLDDFEILIRRMEKIYEKFITEVLCLPETSNLQQIGAALHKDSFKGTITEGFNIFCMINQLAIQLQDVTEKISSITDTTYYKFYLQNTGNVEIQKDNEIMTIYFPIQPITHFLTFKTKEAFANNVSRESNQHKILDLIAYTPQFIDEMMHLEDRSHDFIKITPEKLSFFRNFSTVLSIGISAVVISFYKYDRIEQEDGSFMITSQIDVWPNRVMEYFGYQQLITSFLLLFGTYLNQSSIIIKTGWRQKITENQTSLANDIHYVLEPLKPKFGDINVQDLPLQAARILLLTQGPYISTFRKNGKLDFHYAAIDFEYKWISLSFLMQNGGFVFTVIYLAFSIQGSIQSPIFYSFHLVDVINRFPQLQNVIASVTKNGNQLLMTAMLGLIIIYIYSTIAFVFVFDTYYDDDVNGGLLNRKGDSVCMSMIHCFLSTINYGLRGGGGIGDFLPTQTAVPENIQGFYFRAIFDVSFFLIVITILLNIIFGIIIDTFAQLRDEAQQKTDDIKNTCFICNIDRQVMDRDSEEGFDIHIQQDHHVWQYLNFVIHLQAIEQSELNGTESYILELFENNEHSWFPMGKSQKINMKSEQLLNERMLKAQAERGVEKEGDIPFDIDPITAIPTSLDNMEEKLGDLCNKY